jgi:hypothetical protein
MLRVRDTPENEAPFGRVPPAGRALTAIRAAAFWLLWCCTGALGAERRTRTFVEGGSVTILDSDGRRLAVTGSLSR